MDDIINIDECLSDSFSLSSDTDIRNIVDQWKHSDLVTENKEQKCFDTRTFTRPKKKIFSYSDAYNGFGTNRNRLSSGSDLLVEEAMTSSTSSTEPQQPQIDLKIGGLVTSLQNSFLGDVTPPRTTLMESSIEPMGNSLITSSDFSNINEFINANEDSLSLAQFKNYRLSDAISDRNFLERLTHYDDSLFSKDADINNIDGNNLIGHTNGGENFSGNSTLQNSTDSSSNLGSKGDETFVPAKIGCATFNTSQSAAIDGSNRTFIQNTSIQNGTFDAASAVSANSTFNKSKGIAGMHIETMDMLDNEQMSLQGSFDDFKKPEGYGNTTNNLSMQIEEEIGSPIQLATAAMPIPADAYQSTPARKDFVKNSRRCDSLANISPILSDDLIPIGGNRNIQQVDKFVDVEIDEFPVFLRNTSKSDARSANPLAVMNLREEERQSLKNFEDFENTLLMLENNKNEDEFDDLLNRLGGNVGKSQKVRQSLDIIKKRHSLINMEKQYHDELNREKNSNSIRCEQTTVVSERAKLNDSFSKSAMISSTSSSASSSGERLLRRSRLYDDVIPTSGNQLNTSGSSISSNDNKHTTMENDSATESLNRKNLSYLMRDIEKTDQQMNQYNVDDASARAHTIAETKANNRDRFKTIRIFKKPPENAVQVPDVGAAHDETYTGMQSFDHFTQKNTNSPQSSAEAKAINTMTFKKSALARPKYLGGIQKRDAYTKSSSHEILSNDDSYDHVSNGAQATKPPPLKSPMGVKSKSVHSLVTSNKMSFGLSRPLAAASTSAQNTGTFKIPKPLATLRQPAAIAGHRNIGLMRPSSGYYSYNVKRLDSDSESGRCSSNNSLSSGSSKGSLNKPEYETALNSTFATNSNPNSTFAVASSADLPSNKLTNGTGSNMPRPSGLRLPTQIRKSGLPRPMAIPKR